MGKEDDEMEILQRYPEAEKTTNQTDTCMNDSEIGSKNQEIGADCRSQKENLIGDVLRSIFCKRIGLWLIVISAFVLATAKFFIKLATHSLRPPEVVFFRFFIQTVLLTPGTLYHRSSFKKIQSGSIGKFVVASLCKAFAQGACFYALSMILLADAAVLMNTQPVFVCIIAWIWLGEAIGAFELVVAFLTLVGVVLVCHPSFVFHDKTPDRGTLSLHIWGSLITIVAALFNAIGNCLTRRMEDINYIVIVFAQGFVALPICILILFATSTFQIPKNETEYVYIIVLSLLCCLGRALETRAFQLDQATPLTILKTLEILGCLFLQYVFLKTSPSKLSIAGTILVISSILVISMKEKIIKFIRISFLKTSCDGESTAIANETRSENELLNNVRTNYGSENMP